MPTYTDMVARAQDQFLDALKRAEDRSVGIVESAGRAAVGIAPTRTLIGRLDSAVPRPEPKEAAEVVPAARLAAALDTAASQARSVPKRSQGTRTKKAAGRPRTTTGARSSSAPDKRATSVDDAASRT